MADRKGILLFEPFSERRLLNQGRYRTTWSPPYALQRKLDGERCRAQVYENGTCLLLSASEEIISTVPHINLFFAENFPPGEYDGELYVHGWSQGKIHSVLYTTTRVHEDAHKMEFHLFDVKTRECQADRIKHYYSLPFAGPIHRVDTTICWNLKDIMSEYDKYIAEGYEGFIIRELSSLYIERRTQLGMKFKPKKKDQYKIIGVNEAIDKYGNPKGMVGSFVCTDDMGSRFDPGAGKLKHDKRKEIFEQFKDDPTSVIGHDLLVEYQTLSSKNKVPHFSRAVRIL